MKNKTIIIGAIAVIAIIGLIAFFSGGRKNAVVGTTTTTPGGITYPTGAVLPNPSAFDFLQARLAEELDGPLMFAGHTSTTGLSQMASVGPCITSSSTIFAVQSPFAATTTISQFVLFGTQGATTTDILVATSTTPAPATGLAATSTLGANILNLAAVTNATQFYSVAGVVSGPGKGYTNPKGIPSSLSNQEVVVGPSEWVIGFSTSTATANAGGTGASQVAVPASCTYKIEWQS